MCVTLDRIKSKLEIGTDKLCCGLSSRGYSEMDLASHAHTIVLFLSPLSFLSSLIKAIVDHWSPLFMFKEKV